ncbi:phosphodiesterase/alkaline phosphatase D [Rivularia sp. PCC 7116]|uniref:alkaline phosphatase D family protein n=1 Tax=Rivularia sp. PCC 7116 TaxID=373994 RepID=UPI00029ECF60|nr:alkaline phosphatase D family protein [Rivularia sp. PCC 7116]AFY58681.1 phosphodiesterase/alkaline phosphatase D [Rivularia sp. PCC 7116]
MPSTQTIIKFDDIFYLKHKNGKYLVSVDKGRYNFPRLDNTGKVKLQLKGRNSSDNLKDGDTVNIRSLEASLGENNILGAFSDSHNCYYWKDNYDKEKQGWRIHKASGDKDVIRYGDEVYFTNVSYKNQRLVADTRYDGFLTTKKNVTDTWIIESVQKKQPANESNNNKSASVFGLSVASGDPSATGVILWTRINPEKYDTKKPLKYQVCESNKFDNCVIDEEVKAHFGEDTDYTVHVDLDGKLESGKTYFYRFHYDGVYSKTGRCKTLPRQNENIPSLRLAVITCNDYSTGYFNAFYYLAEEDIDYVIHLGDFVYEYSQYPKGYGKVHREDIKWENDPYGQPYADSKTQRATSLEHFQQIYRTYRQDLALQAAMEQHTWMITLDDHEVADNWYWDYDKKTIEVGSDHPIFKKYKEQEEVEKVKKEIESLELKEEENKILKVLAALEALKIEEVEKRIKEIKSLEKKELEKIFKALEPLKPLQKARSEEMKNLYNNAIKAWRNYVPIKPLNNNAELHESSIYRQFSFGKLVDFFLTDSRSYRSKPRPDLGADDKENTHTTMLGQRQKEWLTEGVKNSKATWKVWGNQTLLATSSINSTAAKLKGEPELIDDWQAYMGERQSILQTIKDSETKNHDDNNKKSNFVVFTGDMHTSMISYLRTDFEGTLNKANMDYSKIAGVEFMTPSLTSPGVSEGLREEITKIPGASTIGQVIDMLPNIFSSDSSDDAGEGSTLHGLTAGLNRFNTYIKHYDSSINGYAIAEFTSSELIWKVYAINKSDCDVADDGSTISKKGVNKHLAKTMKYDPSTINLDD